ncbi:hypothetical protein NE686_00520 [Tissierella carlieri]|uniref:Uncharacterized protein n=1 Tax=Tissierella carlieri TaxID=689904 RepID=A0ABT1S509_9FIRM|nr:hypothetical protein [Tissierella carlieri]MCQ4921552.1 hypothetical protein [Tissierella carlieri]
MEDDLIRRANSIINAKNIKFALEDLRELYLEDVALTAKAIYDEHIKVGFTDAQALEIAKAYTLEFCRLEFLEGEED